MTIVVVQTKSADSNAVTVTSLSVTLDSVPIEGNLIRVMLVTGSSPGTLTPPSGWTLEAQDTSTNANCFAYYKIAGEDESTTISFSWTTARRCTLLAREYSGVDSSDPFDVSSAAAGTAKPLSTGTTGTIGANNTYAEAWFGVRNTSDWETSRTYSNSFTESTSQEESGSAPAIYVAANSAVTPGGTTSVSFDTASIGGHTWGRVVVFTTGPLVAGVVTVENRTATTAELSATDASGGISPYSYQWHRSISSGFTPGVGNEVSGATSLTLSDTGLSTGQTYYYVLAYTDDVSTTVYSAQVSVTPSASPLVVIRDTDENISGDITVMGPNVVVLDISGSLIGSGLWQDCKVEWDFGDPSGDYNEHRGFVGGHFYDVEPVSDTDYTVTCTVTNSAGLSAQATRTVTITPNTRRVVFVDPDDGSATPTDPTDSGDPYDTIVNAIAGETLTNLEVRLTAGKEHAWSSTFGNSGTSNCIVRSTVKGQRFEVAASIGPLVNGGNNMSVRDMLVISSTYGAQVKMLDPRSSNAFNCYMINCEGDHAEVNICFTGSSTNGTLVQDCTSNGHASGGDVFMAGTRGVWHNVQSLGYVGHERPFRGEGDWQTFNQCVAEYSSDAGKTAFTNYGAKWWYVDKCNFSITALADNGSSVALSVGHTSSGFNPGPQFIIIERTMCSVDESLDASESTIYLRGKNHNVDYVTVRNCILVGHNVVIGCEDAAYPATNIHLYHNTILTRVDKSHVIVRDYWSDVQISNNLLLTYVGKESVVSFDHATANTSDQSLVVSANVAPVATSDDDVKLDGSATILSWTAFDSTAMGNENLSKDIVVNGSTYRPVTIDDTDIIKTAIPEMGAVLEDYYGNPRIGGSWIAGAVGVNPDEGSRFLVLNYLGGSLILGYSI